jgi:hypothetical protein
MVIVNKLHAQSATLQEVRAENSDLDWALKQQQDDNRRCAGIHTQQLNSLKKEHEAVEYQLAAARTRCAAAEDEGKALKQQLDMLSIILADKNRAHQSELEALRIQLRVTVQERDMALQARGSFEGEAATLQHECTRLQQELRAKTDELCAKTDERDSAWEELAVAQATIQALQKRVTELSEDSASPAAADDVGALAELQELRARLKDAEDKVAATSKAREVEIFELKAKVVALTNSRNKLERDKLERDKLERDKLKIAAASRPSTPTSSSSGSRRPTPTPSSRSVASSRSGLVGIGMVITDSAPHRVTSVVPGGSAHASGQLREGDTLVSVDETPVEHLDVVGVRNLLLGEPGSKVELILARAAPNDDDEMQYKVRVIRGVQASKPRFI